jgi:2-polyprenyl-3-methyl-5-hydroxy-6-metoxy-1,4-benzoquinol methylase
MNLAEVFVNSPANQSDVAQVVQQNGLQAQVAQRPTSETARLEALLKAVEDISSLSPELMERAILEKFWYHVTPFRSALIRALELPVGSRILEIGCGAGNLTRYMGERGFQVVALETNEALVECARARCRDLANVEVVHGFVESVVGEDKFDFVVCVDPLLVTSEYYNPGVQLFALCRNLLKATGSFILAVENPLFAPGGGHVEESPDHVRGKGAPLEGIRQSLSSAGFTGCETFMTYPHHAAPQLLVETTTARTRRVPWTPMVSELYKSSATTRDEVETWLRAICAERIENALAPGWLIVAHAHTVHSIVWNGWAVKSFELSTHEDQVGERIDDKGITISNLPLKQERLVSIIKNLSRPQVNSVKDYKFSLRAADSRIGELLKREDVLKNSFEDTEKRLKRDLSDEREMKRVREAELDLVLKQYHAIGAMCQEMRQEGKALREMVSELRHKYQTSETWASALAGRVADAETELYTARSSLAWKITNGLKGVKNSVKEFLFS